jgi:proteasome inhibitor subunit 1 (PI31)
MDILDPSALLSAAPKLLPSSSISLSSPQDALALLLHTVMATLGFRLVATDESSPGKESGDNHLPEGWNKNGPDSYTFRYKHEQSTLVFLLKIVKLGNRTLVHGIATEV